MRAPLALLLWLIAAPAAAQGGYGDLGPDSPAVQNAARMALPNAVIRRITPEVRRIEGLAAVAGGVSRTVAGEVTTLEGLSRSLQGSGLQTRMVASGLEVSLPGDVLFNFNQASIRTSAIPTLEKVAGAARQMGDRPIRVEGHSDAIGQPAYNLRLSQARAKAVVDWLSRSGISSGRLSSDGYGATRPVAPNRTPSGGDDPAGRQKNRRVTVTFAR